MENIIINKEIFLTLKLNLGEMCNVLSLLGLLTQIMCSIFLFQLVWNEAMLDRPMGQGHMKAELLLLVTLLVPIHRAQLHLRIAQLVFMLDLSC